MYRRKFNIICTKFQKLDVSRLVLQLSWPKSIEASYYVANEDVVGVAPTGDAPITSEWSTILCIFLYFRNRWRILSDMPVTRNCLFAIPTPVNTEPPTVNNPQQTSCHGSVYKQYTCHVHLSYELRAHRVITVCLRFIDLLICFQIWNPIHAIINLYML